PLEKDLELTDRSMSYGDSPRRTIVQPRAASPPVAASQSADDTPPDGPDPSAPVAGPASSGPWPLRADGSPDFERMDATQRQAYDQHRLSRRFGSWGAP